MSDDVHMKWCARGIGIAGIAEDWPCTCADGQNEIDNAVATAEYWRRRAARFDRAASIAIIELMDEATRNYSRHDDFLPPSLRRAMAAYEMASADEDFNDE